MRFENDFQVEAPVDEVFETLLDLDRVAPAMPGAEVTDHVGDDAYKVAIKVKLGPMTMNYRGDVEIREKDEQAHRATMHVKAREARGQGNATADVTMALAEEDGGTHARIAADVQLAGKAAAMGRGLIEDVSAKLVDQFAQNLASMLSEPKSEPSAAGNGAGAPAGAAEEPAGEAAASAEREAERPAAASSAAQSAPSAGGEAFDASELVAGVAADKLREPRNLALAIGGALAVGYLLGRRSGR